MYIQLLLYCLINLLFSFWQYESSCPLLVANWLAGRTCLNRSACVGPTRRTVGDALVGPPGADEDVQIPDDRDREPHPRLLLAPSRAV